MTWCMNNICVLKIPLIKLFISPNLINSDFVTSVFFYRQSQNVLLLLSFYKQCSKRSIQSRHMNLTRSAECVQDP